MAYHDDHDISIISHNNDMAEDSADEADTLARHFTGLRSSAENTDSLPIFRKAYEDLKISYNNLVLKSEQKDYRIRELENQLNATSSSDYSTDSFLMVEPQAQSTEVGILQGRIKELERKNMIAEVNIKSLQAEKSQLEMTLKGLTKNDQNRDSLEKTKNLFLEEKVKKLTERLEKFSILDMGRDIEVQLTELKTDLRKTKDENLSMATDLRKLTEENASYKRKLYANNQTPTGVLSNGITGAILGASKEATTHPISDMSLNSSMPAVDELENLKHVIKKLKTVVETQNAYLLKLDSNAVVRKILRDEKLALSMNGVKRSGDSSNRGSNSSVDKVGSNENLMDSGYLNRSSPNRALSPVGNAKLIPNDTFSPFRNGADLSDLEQYDNLELPSKGHLRQYQSKSQSEVISRMHDATRRQSQTLRSTNSAPIFLKESATVFPPPSSREFVYGHDRTDGVVGSKTPTRDLVVARSTSQRESDRIPSIKSCPVCNADYTHKSVNEFQTHVFNCVDSEDQPNTLTCDSVPERICPMCNHLFPQSCPQLEVDNHVNAHFGEAPTDAFEILSPSG